MKLDQQEEILDCLLADLANPANGPQDRNWILAAEQLERQLAENFGSIDQETLLRILSKSISAVNKLQTSDAVRRNRNLEEIVKRRIDDYHYWQGINEALPKVIRSEAARKSAIASHEKTYKKRDEVIEYWRANISRDKSNEFAAERLQEKFPGISHRTLTKYVALAKKLQPASTL